MTDVDELDKLTEVEHLKNAAAHLAAEALLKADGVPIVAIGYLLLTAWKIAETTRRKGMTDIDVYNVLNDLLERFSGKKAHL